MTVINGCGFALQSYMMECIDLIAGRTQTCESRCKHALIGLISTDEGKELMNCDCNNNKYCELSKSRLEICRKPVWSAIKSDTIVSCSIARWICITDQPCRTALEYYEQNCHQLFQGHKCTNRCNNSLSILDRQEKAMKLRTCYCDGTENFPCRRIKYFTERICYSNHHHHHSHHQHHHPSDGLLPIDLDNNNQIEPIGHQRIQTTNDDNNQNHVNNHNYHRYRIDSIFDRIRGGGGGSIESNYSTKIFNQTTTMIMMIIIMIISSLFVIR
ncbi:growth arrest-specific protein 1-like isoform X3 [Dermatophagoides pteronyssinus]|uniref:Growth arrest-specific protein 1-like isoform X2 n=1 Tax=Dermatophagoides pteronyssinus TaxID=6956 RepID=A0A6P6XVM7_DERPT|nr:growth arrest-specific protein 1-like isoform X2 [Dermatophagoides pteronyssinus]